MQDPQGDTGHGKRVGVDERFIKFTSSPNFKGMKKFIISKIEDNIDTSSESSPTQVEAVDAAAAGRSEAPPASPAAPPAASPSAPPAAPPATPAAPPAAPPSEGVMCRDFVRGTCSRPGTCKYAHKFDTSQLVGVYTFCRDFQNRICTLENCKYVHASIFEEQEFYRTGKLPPHVLANKPQPPAPAHKPAAVPPPPPPPPLPPPALLPHLQNTENRIEMPPSFFSAPPPLRPSIDGLPMARRPPFIACALARARDIAKRAEHVAHPSHSSHAPHGPHGPHGPHAPHGPHGPHVPHGPPPLHAPPPLHPSHPPPALHSREPRPFHYYTGGAGPSNAEFRRNCKFCPLTDFRLRLCKEQVEKKRQSVEEWKIKVMELERKKEKMSALSLGLLKLTLQGGPSSLFNAVGADKNKMFVDQITKYNSNNRLSILSDDNASKSLLGDNNGFVSLLAKVLADQQGQGEGARAD